MSKTAELSNRKEGVAIIEVGECRNQELVLDILNLGSLLIIQVEMPRFEFS
jgi:hypothetical protein